MPGRGGASRRGMWPAEASRGRSMLDMLEKSNRRSHHVMFYYMMGGARRRLPIDHSEKSNIGSHHVMKLYRTAWARLRSVIKHYMMGPSRRFFRMIEYRRPWGGRPMPCRPAMTRVAQLARGGRLVETSRVAAVFGAHAAAPALPYSSPRACRKTSPELGEPSMASTPSWTARWC